MNNLIAGANGNKSKVILVTGASSGIGLDVARRLSEDGHIVYGTSRRENPDLQTNFEMLTLDVRSEDSINTAVQKIVEEEGRIDVLINNAGFILMGFLEEASIEEAKSVFETNFFGLVRMVNSVLPLMRKQKSGHIINISSLVGLVGAPGMGFYGATKYAVEGYSETLKYELERFNIKVSVVEPGYFKTNIRNAWTEVGTRIDDYNNIRGGVWSAIQQGIEKGSDPEKIAELITQIAETKSSRLRYRVGSDAVWIPRLKAWAPESAFANGLRKSFNLK